MSEKDEIELIKEESTDVDNFQGGVMVPNHSRDNSEDDTEIISPDDLLELLLSDWDGEDDTLLEILDEFDDDIV